MLEVPVAAQLLPKLGAGLAARAALLGMVGVPSTDDMGRPVLTLTRGPWTETLALRQAEQLLGALEAAMGRIPTIRGTR